MLAVRRMISITILICEHGDHWIGELIQARRRPTVDVVLHNIQLFQSWKVLLIAGGIHICTGQGVIQQTSPGMTGFDRAVAAEGEVFESCNRSINLERSFQFGGKRVEWNVDVKPVYLH